MAVAAVPERRFAARLGVPGARFVAVSTSGKQPCTGLQHLTSMIHVAPHRRPLEEESHGNRRIRDVCRRADGPAAAVRQPELVIAHAGQTGG
jgi:hypothetical protein